MINEEIDLYSYPCFTSLNQLEPYVVRRFNVVRCFVTILFFVENVDVLVGKRNITFIFVRFRYGSVALLCNVLEYPYVRIALAGEGGDQ